MKRRVVILGPCLWAKNEWWEFQFRGCYRGELIKKIYVRGFQEELIIGGVYLIYADEISYQEHTLFAKSYEYRLIDDSEFLLDPFL